MVNLRAYFKLTDEPTTGAPRWCHPFTCPNKHNAGSYVCIVLSKTTTDAY
jgi:hypothetical protein